MINSLEALQGEDVTSIAAAWQKIRDVFVDSDDALNTLLSASLSIAEEALSATPAKSPAEIAVKLKIALETEDADWADSSAKKLFESALKDLKELEAELRLQKLGVFPTSRRA